MQVTQAFMVGGFGTDFADTHYFVSIYTDWIFEPVAVPELK
jgi:hypothetical protein